MRIWPSVVVALLALFSVVSGARVFATIPNGSLPQNASGDDSLIEPRGRNDVEVTGFITRNGDIFELSDSLGTIESRQEPELEPGTTMCRYGTIVVYSDSDCSTFFRPSQSLGLPVKTENKIEEEQSAVEEKPPKKKKKKKKGSRRKSDKNKVQKKNKKRKNKVRRKALKKRGNKKRRRNSQKQKRKKNKQRTQRRGASASNKKRNRIDKDESSRSNPQPMQFAILYDRH